MHDIHYFSLYRESAPYLDVHTGLFAWLAGLNTRPVSSMRTKIKTGRNWLCPTGEQPWTGKAVSSLSFPTQGTEVCPSAQFLWTDDRILREIMAMES